MRILILCILTVALSAQDKPKLEQLNWLAGNWTGTMGRATLEENWLAPAGGAMLGVGRTIAGPRMVAFEFLRIVEKDGDIFYIAQPNGRPPTEFKLTAASESKAVFENPQHDHPKIITYEKDAQNNLTATIEGDERGQHKKQQFRFRRAATGTSPNSSQ